MRERGRREQGEGGREDWQEEGGRKTAHIHTKIRASARVVHTQTNTQRKGREKNKTKTSTWRKTPNRSYQMRMEFDVSARMHLGG